MSQKITTTVNMRSQETMPIFSSATANNARKDLTFRFYRLYLERLCCCLIGWSAVICQLSSFPLKPVHCSYFFRVIRLPCIIGQLVCLLLIGVKITTKQLFNFLFLNYIKSWQNSLFWKKSHYFSNHRVRTHMIHNLWISHIGCLLNSLFDIGE